MSLKFVFPAVLTLLIPLAGCTGTPRQQYEVQAAVIGVLGGQAESTEDWEASYGRYPGNGTLRLLLAQALFELVWNGLVSEFTPQ